MNAPPFARVGDPDTIDRVIAILAAHGQEHRVALLRAVRRGEVNLIEAMRAGIVPSRVLKDKSRPLVVLIGDDDYVTTGPTGWSTLPKLLRWANGAMVHASGGDAPSYEMAIGMALTRRRFLLVEASSERVREWGDALLAKRIPFVCFVPREGAHPVPIGKENVH